MYINVSIHYPYVTHCIASGRWQQEHATVRYGHSCSWTMQQNFRWSIILKRSMSSNSSGMRSALGDFDKFEMISTLISHVLAIWQCKALRKDKHWKRSLTYKPLSHCAIPRKSDNAAPTKTRVYTVRFRSACACDKQNLWLIKGQCSMPITRARWLQLSWHGKPVRGFVQSQSRLQYPLDHMHGESNILQRNYLQWLWF